ncbi:MAG: hypothetical protein JNN08_09195 [Bryobacterales bacterium]|nr:hypothetical protein [Bryobacterales bacterium]
MMVAAFARFAERLQSAAGAIARWCDAHRFLVFALFSTVHIPALVVVAKGTQFWFDELFTYYLARLPAVADIYAELDKAVDHHPPAFFLLHRFVSHWFSDPHIGFRIPSIAGFWMFYAAVFVFVSRRASAVFGLLAIFLAYASGARYWATEARPYGLALGLCAVAVLCWQMAADTRKRLPWLVGLAVALASTISISYYSVLIFIPLGAAELVRTIRRGKIDFPMWSSLAAGAAGCLPYLLTVRRHLDSFSPHNWARPRPGVIPETYNTFFASLQLFMLAALMSVALLWIFRQWASRNSADEKPLLPEDLALALGHLLLPLIGAAVALFATKMITPRYVISTVTGFCILVPLIAYGLSRDRALTGVLLMALGGLFFAQSNAEAINASLKTRMGDVSGITNLLRRVPDGTEASLPVVSDNAVGMLQLTHYGGPELSSRLRLLTNPEAALRYSGVYYIGHGLFLMQKYAPLRVETYEAFRKNHSRFLYYESPSLMAFLTPLLQADRAKMRFLAKQGGTALYLIEGFE